MNCIMRHKAMATFVLWGMISPSLILYPIRSSTYAVGNLTKCTTQHCFFFIGETADTTIAIDAIELVVKPRCRLAEICVGYLSPRHQHLYVLDALFYRAILGLLNCNYFHNFIFLCPPRREDG